MQSRGLSDSDNRPLAERLQAVVREAAGAAKTVGVPYGTDAAAISGAGEHGAIIHYRVTEQSNRAIRPNEVYLIDSGAQYADGTTDITRTIWTGPGVPPESVRD